MVAEALEEYALASVEAHYENPGNRCQWDSWPHEDDFMMEMLLTGRIRNIPNLPDQLTQIIPTVTPWWCVLVWPKSP